MSREKFDSDLILTQLGTLSAGCAAHRALVLILAQTFLEMLSTISNWSFQTGNVMLWRDQVYFTGPISSGRFPLTGDQSRRGQPSSCSALSRACSVKETCNQSK